MSPTCCILSLPGPLSVPGLNQFFKDNVSLDTASSLIFTALSTKPQPAQTAAPVQAWLLPLQELASAHRVERGSAAELSAYQAVVKRQIEAALEGVAGEQPLGLSEQLQKALRLVKAGKTSQGHAVAVELLGFAGLAGLAAVSGRSRKCAAWKGHGPLEASQNAWLQDLSLGIGQQQLLRALLYDGFPLPVALLESLSRNLRYVGLCSWADVYTCLNCFFLCSNARRFCNDRVLSGLRCRKHPGVGGPTLTSRACNSRFTQVLRARAAAAARCSRCQRYQQGNAAGTRRCSSSSKVPAASRQHSSSQPSTSSRAASSSSESTARRSGGRRHRCCLARRSA